MAARQEATRANAELCSHSEPERAGAAAKARRRDFFLKAPVEIDSDKRLLRAASRTKQPLANVFFVWFALQKSAQLRDAGGEFEVDSDLLAFQLNLSADDVAAIVAAFASPGVELVPDGRLTTFISKTYASERGARYDNSVKRKLQRKAQAEPQPDADQGAARKREQPGAGVERGDAMGESDASASESDARASDSAAIESSSEEG